jgi:excinuclease ABC subunit A
MTIQVRGAREHNLRAVDLDLAIGSFVVFCGPSGSGKTSLAFDTLYAEAQRRYLEAMATRVRRAAGSLRRPEVDLVRGLPPAIALPQEPPPVGVRTTLATLLEVLPMLRVLFGRCGTLHCPTCGDAVRPSTIDQIVAELLALPADTRLTIESGVRVGPDPRGTLDEIVRAGFSRVRLDDEVLRTDEITADQLGRAQTLRVVVDRIRLGQDRRDRLYDAVRTAARAGKGVVVAVTEVVALAWTDRPYCPRCDRSLPALSPSLLSYAGTGRCPACAGRGDLGDVSCQACGGTRLSEEARAVRWRGHTFGEVWGLTCDALAALCAELVPDAVEALPISEIRHRTKTACELGLGPLPLDRPVPALASGEYQRARLARQVGAGLAGVLYVLDEPAAGLLGKDAERVVQLIRALCAEGNTVIAVDHAPEVIAAADRVIEFGPGPGERGGTIVFDGLPADLLAGETATGRWLTGRATLDPPANRPPATSRVRFVLHGRVVDARFPVGALVAVTGPSGAGKTSLLRTLRQWLAARIDGEGPVPAGVFEGLDSLRRVYDVERGVQGRMGRSSPATYVGLWDTLRELFAATAEAQIRGFTPATFSLAQHGGRCEACAGDGTLAIDLGLLPAVHVPCDACGGRRFLQDVLAVTWKGLSPDAVLGLEVDAAHAVLAGHPKLEQGLRALRDTGLGYVQLGQPSWSLSGGETQRLRLARELVRAGRNAAGTLFLVDDAAVGLHPADLAVLVALYRKLVAEGATVLLATDHPLVRDAADAVIALGGQSR